MGDITDGILSGTFCRECGDYLGKGFDSPRLCNDCREEKEELADEKDQRREASRAAYREASVLAAQHGLRVTAHNNFQQYNIARPGQWTIQFYPGNGRLYSPREKGGPYLGFVGQKPTILEVVQRAISAEEGR